VLTLADVRGGNALPSISCGSKAWMPGRCRGPPGRPPQPVLRSDGEAGGQWMASTHPTLTDCSTSALRQPPAQTRCRFTACYCRVAR
jgi:hypothetical protein